MKRPSFVSELDPGATYYVVQSQWAEGEDSEDYDEDVWTTISALTRHLKELRRDAVIDDERARSRQGCAVLHINAGSDLSSLLKEVKRLHKKVSPPDSEPRDVYPKYRAVKRIKPIPGPDEVLDI